MIPSIYSDSDFDTESPAAHHSQLNKDSDAKLDSLIGGILDRNPSMTGEDNEPQRKKGGSPDMRGLKLHDMVGDRLDQAEASAAEHESLQRARPDHDELTSRNNVDLD